MTSREKIEYVWDRVIERARISPVGFFYIRCTPLIDIELNKGIPDDAPIVISREEQLSIIRKFEEDGLLLFVDYKSDKDGVWAALSDPEIKDKNGSPYIFSTTGTQIEPEEKTTTNLGKGVLCIKGKEVRVGTKSGAETNSLMLLKTLMKEPERPWFKDEIYEDWENGNPIYKEDLDKVPQNRLYNAARALNVTILEQSGVKDFIEFDTKKFQINQRYLRDL